MKEESKRNLTWNESMRDEEIALLSNIKAETSYFTPFKFDKDLNSKIYLLNCDLAKVRAEGLVLQCNKNIFNCSSYRTKILKKCGPGVFKELEKYEKLSLSECIVTGGYSLPYKSIIHTTLPKYTINYHNACEATYHLAIRNVIDTCMNKGIRTVCFSKDVIKPSSEYPLMLAMNIFTRTIRRCLEKLRGKFDNIFIILEENETFEKYREILKLYFPRSKEEENLSAKYLPDIKETEFGDSLIPDRIMEIKSNPLNVVKNEVFSSNSHAQMEKELTEEDDSYYLEEMDTKKLNNYEMYRTDQMRIQDVLNDSHNYLKNFYFCNKRLLTRNVNDDLDNINFIKYAGKDMYRRQIFLLDLDKLDFEKLDKILNPILIYVINYFSKHIEPDKGYYGRISVIFLCQNSTNKNFPPAAIVNTINNILASLNNVRWDTNDFIFYKASFLFRLYVYFMRFFINGDVWSQISFLNNSKDVNKSYDFCSENDNLDEYFSNLFKTQENFDSCNRGRSERKNTKEEDDAMPCLTPQNTEIYQAEVKNDTKMKGEGGSQTDVAMAQKQIVTKSDDKSFSNIEL